MRVSDPTTKSRGCQAPRETPLAKVLEMQYHPAMGRMWQQSSETPLDTLEEIRLTMKKSFFLYPTAGGDVVLSGYPSWVRHSKVYPFRIYTFLLDEGSSARIGEKSVTINSVDLLSDDSKTPALPTDVELEQLTLNFTPWRR